MTAAERRHVAAVVALGCAVCQRPAEAHHVRRDGAKRDHMRVAPLCPRHHRTGGPGVAIHAGRQSWEANYGTEGELLAWVERQVE